MDSNFAHDRSLSDNEERKNVAFFSHEYRKSHFSRSHSQKWISDGSFDLLSNGFFGAGVGEGRAISDIFFGTGVAVERGSPLKLASFMAHCTNHRSWASECSKLAFVSVTPWKRTSVNFACLNVLPGITSQQIATFLKIAPSKLMLSSDFACCGSFSDFSSRFASALRTRE